MKTIVRYLDGSTEEFNADGVAINNAGLLVVVKDSFVLGTFVPQNIVGITHPDGPPKVQIPGVKL